MKTIKTSFQLAASGAIRSIPATQLWQLTVATANEKPQEKLTLKFHSVLCTVHHRHGMTPQLCGTAALVYK